MRPQSCVTTPLGEKEIRIQTCTEDNMKMGENTAICKLEKTLQESNPEDILTSDLQFQNHEKIKLLFKSLSLHYFVMAEQANYYALEKTNKQIKKSQ